MRIAILASGVRTGPGRPPAYLLGLEPEASLDVAPLRAKLFPYTPADLPLVTLDVLDAAFRAHGDGADAVLIDTFGEYALDAARAALDVPVVGAAEAAFAAVGRRRFAVVTVWPPSMRWIYEDRFRRHEVAARCTGVFHVAPLPADSEAEALDRMRGEVREPTDVLRARVAAACDAAAASGAEVLVLGCTCMAPLLDDLRTRVSLPIVCPSRAGLYAAAAAARARPHVHADVDAELSERVRSAVDALEALTADGTACPVCITEVRDD